MSQGSAPLGNIMGSPMGGQMNLSTMNNTNSPTLGHSSRSSVSHVAKNSPGSRHSSMSSAASHHTMMQLPSANTTSGSATSVSGNGSASDPSLPDSEQLGPDGSGDGTTTGSEPVEDSKLPSYLRRKKPPKAKFTADDDDLLVELKEKKKLTWKQIADHFDGRTAGALQVRYCTKLKGRSIDWTQEDVEALHEAMREYEEERWIIVSQKMGSKFTASICRDKFKSLGLKPGDIDTTGSRVPSVVVDGQAGQYQPGPGALPGVGSSHYMSLPNGATHNLIN